MNIFLFFAVGATAVSFSDTVVAGSSAQMQNRPTCVSQQHDAEEFDYPLPQSLRPQSILPGFSIDALITQLDANTYNERRTAALELLARGSVPVAAIRQALHAEDKGIAFAAQAFNEYIYNRPVIVPLHDYLLRLKRYALGTLHRNTNVELFVNAIKFGLLSGYELPNKVRALQQIYEQQIDIQVKLYHLDNRRAELDAIRESHNANTPLQEVLALKKASRLNRLEQSRLNAVDVMLNEKFATSEADLALTFIKLVPAGIDARMEFTSQHTHALFQPRSEVFELSIPLNAGLPAHHAIIEGLPATSVLFDSGLTHAQAGACILAFKALVAVDLATLGVELHYTVRERIGPRCHTMIGGPDVINFNVLRYLHGNFFLY